MSEAVQGTLELLFEPESEEGALGKIGRFLAVSGYI